MKKYLNLIVLGIILIGVSGFYISKKVDFHDMLLSIGYYEDKVTIVNTADIHGRMILDNVNGEYFAFAENYVEMGLALIKSIADEVRKNNPKTLFLDSGDLMHGTPEAAVNQGEGMIEAVNRMGYDAMTVGNHDFNWGWERTMEFKEALNFPMLSANIYKDGKPAFEPYKIFDVGGWKIGVFGLTTEQFLQNMQVYDTTGITYEDPINAAKEVVAELQAHQVDAIVLLSHLGDDKDKEWIIEHVDGIDFVLSGHGHALYKKAEKVKDTYIAEAGDYSQYVGVADLYYKDGKVKKVTWNLIQTTDKSKEDPVIAEIVEKFHALALEAGKEVVGETTVHLDGIRWNVRTKETNFANLITDAMKELGEADITLFNGGGIRESIPEGEINLYSISNALPFVNSLVTVELKGETIYEAIEHGLVTWPYGASNGGFLQVSGIEYTIDGSKPAGKRLAGVTRNGKPLDKDQWYRVAITDYLLAGGDGYKMFENAKVLKTGELLSDMLAEYIRSQGVVSPELEGRIVVVNQRYK